MENSKQIIIVSITTILLVAIGIILFANSSIIPNFDWAVFFSNFSVVFTILFVVSIPLFVYVTKNTLHALMINLGILFFAVGFIVSSNSFLDSSKPTKLQYKVINKDKFYHKSASSQSSSYWDYYLDTICKDADIQSYRFSSRNLITEDQWNEVFVNEGYYVNVNEFTGFWGLKRWKVVDVDRFSY